MTPSPRERAEACQGFGTPIEPSDFADPYERLLADILDRANTLFRGLRTAAREEWRDRPFHITFTDGTMMNARCRRYKGVDYIIVPVGAVEQVGGAAVGIMAEPSFCPRIGEASLESGIDIDLTDGFPAFPVLRKEYDENMKLSVVWPECPVRARYGQHLLFNAISVIIMHEMGHIFGGHLDAELVGDSGYADMSFASTSATGDAQEPSRFVKELDADTFATFNLSLFEMSDQIRSLAAKTFPWRGLPVNKVAFVTLANTIGVLFRITERRSWAFPEPSSSHPAPIVRTLFALGNMASCCINANLLKMEDGPGLVDKSVRAIDRVWQMHQLPGHRLENNRDWIANVRTLSADLNQQYELHRPALAKLARLKPIWQGGYWPGNGYVKSASS